MNYSYKCPCCLHNGVDNWVYLRDTDNGDWCEEVYACKNCGYQIYVELPD